MSSVPDTGTPSRIADLINGYCQEVDTKFAALIKAKGEPHYVRSQLADRILGFLTSEHFVAVVCVSVTAFLPVYSSTTTAGTADKTQKMLQLPGLHSTAVARAAFWTTQIVLVSVPECYLHSQSPR